MELDSDVHQMENEETFSNATAIPSVDTRTNSNKLESKTQDFGDDASDMLAGDSYVAENARIGYAVPEGKHDNVMEDNNCKAGVPVDSDSGVQESREPKISLPSENDQRSESIQFDKDKHAVSETEVSPLDTFQDETTEVEVLTCLTANAISDGGTIKSLEPCDSAKIDSDTAYEHDVSFAAHDTIDDDETQWEGDKEIEVETMTEEDLAKNEDESEKVLIEASKKCVNDFIQMSRTKKSSDDDITMDESKVEEVNSSVIKAEEIISSVESNPQDISYLASDIPSESQEITCTDALADGTILEMDYGPGCNSLETDFGPKEHDLPSEIVTQNNNCTLQAAEL